MKIDGKYDSYIIYSEKGYKNRIRLSIFIGVYWIWCLFWFLISIFKIAILHNYSSGLWTGVVNLICLFVATLLIEDLINDH